MNELAEESVDGKAEEAASSLSAEGTEPVESTTETELARNVSVEAIEKSEKLEEAEEVEVAEEPDDIKEAAEPEATETRTENQVKGEDFEGKTVDEMLKLDGVELIYGGAKSHGFDPCFYHPDVGIVVTDCKDYGSEDKPGYVEEVSAFKPERIAPNMTKMLEDMDANDEILQETKDDVWQAFGENKGSFLVVGSDTTRMSENKQAEWGQFTNISDLKSTIDSLRKN